MDVNERLEVETMEYVQETKRKDKLTELDAYNNREASV